MFFCSYPCRINSLKDIILNLEAIWRRRIPNRSLSRPWPRESFKAASMVVVFHFGLSTPFFFDPLLPKPSLELDLPWTTTMQVMMVYWLWKRNLQQFHQIPQGSSSYKQSTEEICYACICNHHHAKNSRKHNDHNDAIYDDVVIVGQRLQQQFQQFCSSFNMEAHLPSKLRRRHLLFNTKKGARKSPRCPTTTMTMKLLMTLRTRFTNSERRTCLWRSWRWSLRRLP